MQTTLHTELRRRLDLQAIEHLKYRYAALCDQDYAPDAIADLFLPDATWDGDRFGVQHGREAIRAFFRRAGQLISFTTHYLLNPQISLDGDTAHATWLLWQQMVLRGTGGTYWLMGRYSDTYTRSDGRWLFAAVEMRMLSFTPYEAGPGRTLVATVPA